MKDLLKEVKMFYRSGFGAKKVSKWKYFTSFGWNKFNKHYPSLGQPIIIKFKADRYYISYYFYWVVPEEEKIEFVNILKQHNVTWRSTKEPYKELKELTPWSILPEKIILNRGYYPKSIGYDCCVKLEQDDSNLPPSTTMQP